MFKQYKTRVVEREAVKIKSEFVELLDRFCGAFWYCGDGVDVGFTAQSTVRDGDFIVRENDTDFYHVPANVFNKKYEEL